MSISRTRSGVPRTMLMNTRAGTCSRRRFDMRMAQISAPSSVPRIVANTETSTVVFRPVPQQQVAFFLDDVAVEAVGDPAQEWQQRARAGGCAVVGCNVLFQAKRPWCPPRSRDRKN
jgi:hypothetical protein